MSKEKSRPSLQLQNLMEKENHEFTVKFEEETSKLKENIFTKVECLMTSLNLQLEEKRIELESSKNEIEQLKKEKNELIAKLNEKQEEIDKKSEQIAVITKQSSRNCLQADSAQRALTQANEKIQQLKISNSNIKKEADDVREELLVQVLSLKNDNKDLINKITWKLKELKNSSILDDLEGKLKKVESSKDLLDFEAPIVSAIPTSSAKKCDDNKKNEETLQDHNSASIKRSTHHELNIKKLLLKSGKRRVCDGVSNSCVCGPSSKAEANCGDIIDNSEKDKSKSNKHILTRGCTQPLPIDEDDYDDEYDDDDDNDDDYVYDDDDEDNDDDEDDEDCNGNGKR